MTLLQAAFWFLVLPVILVVGFWIIHDVIAAIREPYLWDDPRFDEFGQRL